MAMTHRSSPMHCAVDWLGKSALLLVFGAFGLYLWAVYLEKPWLEYRALPWEVIEPVKPGEMVPVIVLRCNHTGERRTYRVTRNLVNVDTGDQIVLPSSDTDIEPGCHRSISKLSLVPSNVPDGTYVLSGLGHAKGRLQVHEVPWTTQRFEVKR